jgi:DNA modification methylase
MKDRIVELIRVRAGELEDSPDNWRTHGTQQREVLRGLLEDIGYADALLARREGDRLILIDGHLRKRLSKDQAVPVLVLDVDEREADLLLATLDPVAALAGSNAEALESLLGRIEVTDEAIADLLEHLARDAGIGALAGRHDPDAIPAGVTGRTRPGDLWVLGEHRLLCADARAVESYDVLMAGERASLLVTDPPYGVSYVGKTKRALRISGDEPEAVGSLLEDAFANAASILSPGAALYVFSPAGPGIATFLQAFEAQGWSLRQVLVWAKGRPVLGHADYHFAHEPILYGYATGAARRGRGRGGWYGGDDRSSVIEVPGPVASPEHPTAKPVELIRQLISNSSGRGQLVLDPFGGSGSALIACEQLGRRGRFIEIDPTYCDVAVARFESFTGTRARRMRRRRSA